jgi:hypothetical protein
VRLIHADWIVLAEPAALVRRPGIKVGSGGFRKQCLARRLVQLEKVIVELRGQLLARDDARIPGNKALMREAGNHRCVIGEQQARFKGETVPNSWALNF